jgi:adenosine deaminase
VLSPDSTEVTRERLLALPKPELHVHLDGSPRPATMAELARERGVPLPSYDPAELGRRMVASDTRSLEDYLLRFQLILSVMQDRPALERIAYELAEDNAREGVRWLEVRYCPALNTRDGLRLEDAVEGGLDGLARAEAALPIRAGVILCAIRDHDPAESAAIAEVGVAYRDRGVVGFDLAGPERGFPAGRHREAFRIAAAGGLGITVHAGEAYGPESIEQALDQCGAQRIGHGTRLRQDAALLRRVRDRQIPLEVCITSNVQTGAVASAAEHPVRAYYDADVAVTLNTDNRLVSGTTLTDEYWLAHRALGFGWAELVEIARTGFRGAFLPETGRAALLADLDAVVAESGAAG